MAERTVTIRAVLLDQLTSPLAKARAGLVGIRDELDKVGRGIAPLTGRIAQFVAGVLSIQTARQSLAAAKEEVDAQQRLLAALNGRVRAQQEIVRTAAEIQAVTRTGDEVLVAQAATMRAIGLAADQIPRALRIAVDAAEALGQPFESVARDIAVLTQGGEARGLNRFVDGLKELKEAGASTEEILAFLEKRFQGVAEAAADTTFGRITQEQNMLSDALENVGKVLGEIWLPVLQAGRAQAEKLAAAIASPEFAVFTRFVKENAAEVVRWASILAAAVAVALALKGAIVATTLVVGPLTAAIALAKAAFLALSVTIGVVTSTVAAIGGVFAAMPALILVVVGAAASLAFNFRAIRDAASEIGGKIGDAFRGLDRTFGASAGIRDAFRAIVGFAGQFLSDGRAIVAEIAAGRLSIGDLWDFVRTRLSEFGDLLRAKVAAPASEVFAFLRELSGDVWDLFAAKAEVAGLRAIKALSESVGPGIQKIAVLLDSVFGGTRTIAVEVARGVLEGDFPLAPLDLAEKQAEEILERIAAAPERLSERLRARAEQAAKETESSVRKELDLQDRLRESREKNAAGLISSLDEQIEKEAERVRSFAGVVAQAEQALESAQFDVGNIFGDIDEAKIAGLFKSVSQEGREEIGAAISEELERAFQDGEITARKFYDLRRSLAIEANEAELRSAQAIAEERSSALDDAEREYASARDVREFLAEQLRIMEEQRAPASQRAALAGEILEATKDESDALGDVAEKTQALTQAEEQRNSAIVARIRLEKELEDVRASTAETLVAQAEEARNALEEKREEIRALFEDGLLGAQDANQQDALAFETFKASLDGVRLELQELAPEGEAVSAALEKAIAALEKLGEKAEEEAPKLRTALEEVRAQQQRLVEASDASGGTFGDFFSGFGAGAKEMILGMSNLASAGIELGRTLTANLAKGIVDVFVTGKKSLKEFLGEFLLSIAEMIAQLVIYRAVATALRFTGPLSTPSGGGGGGQQANTGGKITTHGTVQRYDRGGQVPGPRVHRDVIPALLTPGEYVHNEAAVAYYGDRFMSAINRRLIPRELLHALNIHVPSAAPSSVKRRFAEGGSVTSSATAFGGGGSSQPSPAYIVASPEAMNRLLAGGGGAMRQWLAENGYQPNGMGRR